MAGPRKPWTQPMTIVVDTREQLAFRFACREDKRIQVVRGTLKTGDYSVQGFEDRICVERKSQSDLFGSCCSKNVRRRERFESEFQRMSHMDFACVVCEADYDQILHDPVTYDIWVGDHYETETSKINPKSVLGTMHAWEQRYKVPFKAFYGREYAEAYTFRVLERFYNDRMEELKNAANNY